ncbi:glutaredoxin family protein [Taklimakanibacter lacteus]|uniref:glutaredoxin family protein n=1 Tax=Taklimakanibacter lacteus TaxID=2268456 RepID=UPI0013C3FB1D
MKRFFLAVVLLSSVAGSAHAGCGKQGVTLYGAYWCPACATAKQFLSRNKISYRYVEVTSSRRAQKAMLRQFGMVAVPAVVIDGRRRMGFDKAWVGRALCLP